MAIVNRYYSSDDITSYSLGDYEGVENVINGNLDGIFGIPYQFLPSVDPRPEGSNIGAKYAEKIVSKMPLLFLTPCRQVFMAGLPGDDRETALQRLMDSNDSPGFTGTGKYYTTEFAYDKYYNYVNTMVTQLCKFSSCSDELVRVGKNARRKRLGTIDWYGVKNQEFNDYFAANRSVVFYLDSFNTVSDSFSNNSTESSLANTINGFSDQANEIKFLLGEKSALAKMMEGTGEITQSITSGLSGTVGDLAGGMLGQLADKGVNAVVHGGKIIFPKIWQNFTYDRSAFSFTIKLRSPDHDTVSILLNVLIPYLHLLGFVLPIGMDDDPNGFISPFLVKAYSKGMFNIDMGLITNLTATRGAECQWNDDGLPTQIDVDITIEDLYSSLFMTPLGADGQNVMSDMFHVVKNTSMMDFLANMAGLNIADQEITRQVTMYTALTDANLSRALSGMWNTVDTKIANFMAKLYK